MIEVIRPGPLATVQDLGRPGFGHLGVPHAGAADAASLRLANRLVGNPEGAAGVELTLGRAVFRFRGEVWVAVTGAPAKITVSAAGRAAKDRDVRHGGAFWVPAGALVQVGAPSAGLRSYVAVRGGIDVPPVLGSRSADLRSGLGPAPLRAGDLLPLGPPYEPPLGGQPPGGQPPEKSPPAHQRPAHQPPARQPPAHQSPDKSPPAHQPPGQVAAPATVMPVLGEPAELTVISGPRDDWFEPGALGVLCGTSYVVTPASDRTGLRLDGPALPRARVDELPSEGVVTGSLQVPPGGRPILLLADHPVTGGYPVIAVVAAADVGLAAQLRPGSRLRFVLGRPEFAGHPLGN